MSARISMRQVAQAAGASVSTVSRALAGDLRITAATRQRIARIAEQLGYVPHPVLATLAANRFRGEGDPALILALLHRQSELPPLRQLAGRQGFALRSVPASDMGRLPGLCRETGAVACIIGVRPPPGAVRLPERVPCIHWLHEGAVPSGHISVELNDWAMTVPATVARIRAAGWRRIGIVLTPADPLHWADEVRHGAALACGCPLLLWRSRQTSELRTWIAREGLDALAMQTILPLQRLLDADVRIPHAVMGLWQEPETAATAGFVSDRQLRNVVTLQQIDNALRHGTSAALRIVLPSRWQEGRSLRPVTSPSRR